MWNGLKGIQFRGKQSCSATKERAWLDRKGDKMKAEELFEKLGYKKTGWS